MTTSFSRLLIVIAVVACLSLARDFFLPIVIAVLLTLTLSPGVKWLTRIGLPRVLSSVLMTAVACGLIVGALWLVTPAIAQWMTTAPDKIERALDVEDDFRDTLQTLKETSDKVSDAVDEIVPSDVDAPQPLVVTEKTWSSKLLTNIQKAFGSLLLILALTLFLLSTGDGLVLNLIRLRPHSSSRRHLIRLFRRLRYEVGRYLGAAFLINLTTGTVTSIGMWLLDMPMPWTWLVLVTLLRFIPYVGVGLIITLLTLVSLTHFDTLTHALIAPGAFLVLTTIVGMFIDPMVHGVRLSVNPVIVFISVLFWGWLWGIAGAIIAVPMLTIGLVVADSMQWTHITRTVVAK